MRNMLILASATLAALFAPALAQFTITTPSQTATPVMPGPREPTNPNANMTPMNNGMNEGRVIAPSRPVGKKVTNGNVKEKARSGVNESLIIFTQAPKNPARDGRIF
jgi:hypothetical protein